MSYTVLYWKCFLEYFGVFTEDTRKGLPLGQGILDVGCHRNLSAAWTSGEWAASNSQSHMPACQTASHTKLLYLEGMSRKMFSPVNL